MVGLLFTFLSFSRCAIDSYSISKDIQELSRFQHQTGGFYDSGRDPNSRDTHYAIWLTSIYGAFSQIDVQQCFRWIGTLRNRDGGAGLYSGAKSSVFGTYCYLEANLLISPDRLDAPRLIEFLKTCYDSLTGLFKNTPDSEPSIEATFYAYEILTKFREVDMTWLNGVVCRTTLSDHLTEDHFDFENISLFKTQYYAAAVAKFVTMTLPINRLSRYITSKLRAGIKDNSISLEDAAAAARAIMRLGDEPIPEELVRWAKLSGSLSDLFHVTSILDASNKLSDFFEIKVFAIENDHRMIELEKEGVTINSLIRHAVAVLSLGRFVNPLMNVTISTRIGDEEPIEDYLQLDHKTGLFASARASSANKLGRLSIEVAAGCPNMLGEPIRLSKSVQSRVSLPIEISSDARPTPDEIIPLGGEIDSGVTFRVTLESKLDDTIEVADSTIVTFAVNDPSGALLHFKSEEFKPQLEFTWEIVSMTLPPGSLSLIVEVGDRVSGIHTHREFQYKIATRLIASNVSVPTGLRLSDLLRVRMTPGLESGNGFRPFEDQKQFDSLLDAAGETFYPQTSSESHRYIMRIKVGGTVVKTTEGEPATSSSDGILVVEFESAVDENLDFATGFSLDFQFRAENGILTPMGIDAEPFVQINSTIVAEGEPITAAKTITYGANVSVAFKLKDQEAERYLAPGRAYPVLVVIAKSDGAVLIEKKCKYVDEGYSAKVQIGAGIPASEVILAVKIRTAGKLVDVVNVSGKGYESVVGISGEILFRGKVKEAGKFAIVAFSASFNGRKLRGTPFTCTVVGAGGEVVAVLPLAQKKKGSELAWNTGGVSGSYALQLRRAGVLGGEPLFVQQIALEGSMAGFIAYLPVEGLAICLAFGFFAWSVGLRSAIRIR